MIHTIHLNDEYIDVKNLLEEIRRCKHGVRFENPYNSNTTPKGYMTSGEFRNRAFEKVNKFCDKHDIL